MNNKLLTKELKQLAKKEVKYINKNLSKSLGKVEGWVEQKIPDKLQDTLEAAIFTSFETVFTKGTGVIEKGYNKSELEFTHKMNAYALSIRPDKKSVKQFSKTSNSTSLKNIALSGTKGVGFGLLGIGLPDIPLFISMMLKGIYEIATSYGYDYNSTTERYFILQIIAVAFSYDNHKLENIEQLNNYTYDSIMPSSYSEHQKIVEVSELLTNDLIYTKFIQGIPLVGVVGGTCDMLFTKKVLDYASIKYQQRFFHTMQSTQPAESLPQIGEEEPLQLENKPTIRKLFLK